MGGVILVEPLVIAVGYAKETAVRTKVRKGIEAMRAYNGYGTGAAKDEG